MERVITQENQGREELKVYVGFCSVATIELSARTV